MTWVVDTRVTIGSKAFPGNPAILFSFARPDCSRLMGYEQGIDWHSPACVWYCSFFPGAQASVCVWLEISLKLWEHTLSCSLCLGRSPCLPPAQHQPGLRSRMSLAPLGCKPQKMDSEKFSLSLLQPRALQLKEERMVLPGKESDPPWPASSELSTLISSSGSLGFQTRECFQPLLQMPLATDLLHAK